MVRLGLDSGFFRIYYDLEEDERAGFAGTTAIFAAFVASSVFALVWIFSSQISVALFENPDGVLWVRLVAVDLLASSFVFVPFALFRIEGRASLLSTFSLVRHAANTVLKVILVLLGQGVTGVLLLRESHISLHTWPEFRYAAIDIFMCGDCRPESAVDILTDALDPGAVRHHTIKRGPTAGTSA